MQQVTYGLNRGKREETIEALRKHTNDRLTYHWDNWGVVKNTIVHAMQ